MRLKQAIDTIPGFRFVIDHMPIMTAIARRYFFSEKWCSDDQLLESRFEEIDRIAAIINNDNNRFRVSDLVHHISCVLDIEATIEGLRRGDVLNDIELFQIKSFALICLRIQQVLDGEETEERLDIAHLPLLDGVVDILDPEKNRMSSFYIYDIYSQPLADLRKKLKQAREEEAAELYQQQVELEDVVRAGLVEQLRPFATDIYMALMEIVRLDILHAKVAVAKEMGLCRPVIVEKVTDYKSLFNPRVRDSLLQQGRDFQPLDISFCDAPTLISGINMGGKTICLKTIALAQAMCQFGLFVPASDARVVLVDSIMVSMEDNQNELSGLSSFASEMRAVDDIIHAIHRGERPLVLIDELARTTNPTEGRAIVGAMLAILSEYRVRSFVTSHYDNIPSDCRRLRVRGLRSVSEGVDLRHIDRFIDYSLLVESGVEVPHEALNIARLLKVDPQLISLASSFL